jgi:hypothetical protein
MPDPDESPALKLRDLVFQPQEDRRQQRGAYSPWSEMACSGGVRLCNI